MKQIKAGTYPSKPKWWWNTVHSCECGWTFELEKGDEDRVEVVIADSNLIKVYCPYCKEIVNITPDPI